MKNKTPLNKKSQEKLLEIDPIIINPLLKTFGKFEQFRVNLKTEQEQAGAIQAFEYSF